ncbi:MAG: NADH-quinone oxidoreductase subunit A [Dehalococcoidia bacterium]|nr:NADH-quinone oxidoreductase subunit A [Dehalococcoidia bacterium]
MAVGASGATHYCALRPVRGESGRLVELQTDQLFNNYIPVLLASIVGFILVLSALIGSRLLAPFSQDREKSTTYECGMLPLRRTSTNVGMRFYLYAILFVIFDVEAVFIFPWALSFVGIGPMAYWTMVIFIAILALGLGYAWKKGALQWR